MLSHTLGGSCVTSEKAHRIDPSMDDSVCLVSGDVYSASQPGIQTASDGLSFHDTHEAGDRDSFQPSVENGKSAER